MANSVGGVGVDNLEGVEGGAKKGFIAGDVEAANIVQPFKPGEHRVVGEKSHMDVGGHAWLPNCGKEGLKTI